MRLPIIALALILAALAAGCLQPSQPAAPTPTFAEPQYTPGDLLRGDLAGAGFDDPNGTPAAAAIVVIAYQPIPGEYVYTLVRPVPGGWAYVYPPDDWETRLARDRATFEAFRLERVGQIEVAAVQPPGNTTAPRPS